MAILLGYFDLALEWAAIGDGDGGSADDLTAAIDALSSINPQDAMAELTELGNAAKRSPALSHVVASKFVDQRRDLTTFHDIPLPKEW
jgi:hypothetical protein